MRSGSATRSTASTMASTPWVSRADEFRRRRAFHLHDRALARARLRSDVHEHCEEVLGETTCRHYLGRELPDGYVALDLLLAAWLEPGVLGCRELTCLD